MDANVNYLGLINMLQTLKNAGLISKAEDECGYGQGDGNRAGEPV